MFWDRFQFRLLGELRLRAPKSDPRAAIDALVRAAPQRDPAAAVLLAEAWLRDLGELPEAERPQEMRSALDAAAHALDAGPFSAGARAPVVITSLLGQDPRDAVVLSRLAERWALPVIPYNTRYFAISATPAYQVLVLNGGENSSSVTSETYYVETALRLAAEGESFLESPFHPTVVRGFSK